MRSLLAASCALACACTPVERSSDGPDLGVLRDAIVGGTVDLGDPEVFMLLQYYSNGQQSGCSATLIAPRSLLTAAHCVDPRIGNASSMQIWAMNKTYVNQASNADLIKVVETRYHPGWNPTVGLDNDIALALLERAPAGVTPKSWNEASVSTFGGRPLRALGYGTTGSSGTGSGTKRTVDLTFRQITTTHIYLGDQVGKGVCHGDSGGPSFHRFQDGVERVVGVHSFTSNQACTDGADIRVDAYASFVRQWLGEKEAPTCAEDGRCLQGCTPVDQDCACASDGTCSTACLNLLKDPDCPRDCVQNGVCSIQTCPAPDVDCVPEGGKCSSDLVCRYRMCVRDPTHPDFYCSKTCASNAECPAGMECYASSCRFQQLPTVQPGQACSVGVNSCTQGTVCTGPAGLPTTCQRPCTSASDCPLGSSCENGLNDFRYCKSQKPTVVLLRAPTQLPVADGCSASGGLPAWWALLSLGLLAIRQRRP